MFKAFQDIHKFHLQQRAFQIKTAHTDGEFAPLQAMKQAMPGGPRVNLASGSEHAPEIERRIKVVKERVRSTRQSLPFTKVPQTFNHVPPKGGMSDTISPKTVMTGETLHCKNHLSLQIGQCCQVHEEDTPHNSLLPRTKGATCLGPSGNSQGGYKFMSLWSVKKIVRRSWDAVPMPATAIDRVNQLGKDELEQFVFTDCSGRIIGDIKLPGVDMGNETPQELDDEDVENAENTNLENTPHETPQEEPIPCEKPNSIEPEIALENENDVQQTQPEIVPAPVPERAPALAPIAVPAPRAPSDEIPGVRRSARVRIPTKPGHVPSMTGSSKHALAVAQMESQGALHPDAHMLHNQNMCQEEPCVVAVIMTQLSLKEQWGDKAKEACPMLSSRLASKTRRTWCS
jgi:hypothetical protein